MCKRLGGSGKLEGKVRNGERYPLQSDSMPGGNRGTMCNAPGSSCRIRGNHAVGLTDAREADGDKSLTLLDRDYTAGRAAAWPTLVDTRVDF